MRLATAVVLLAATALALGTRPFAQTRKLSGELAGGDIEDGTFVLAPDGAHVVFSGNFQSIYSGQEIYTVPADGSGDPIALFPVRQFLGGGGGIPTPGTIRITPDSGRIVFSILHDGYRGDALYSAPLDGSAPARQLVQWPMGDFQITPDGSYVVLAIRDYPYGDLEGLYGVRLDDRIRPVEGEGPFRLTAPRPSTGEILDFQLSPDSRHVVFTYTALDLGCSACDEVDPIELFSVPVDGSAGPHKLSQFSHLPHAGRPPHDRPFADVLGEYVSAFVLSPDGKEVVFVTREQHGPCSMGCSFVTRLFSVPIDGEEPPKTLFQGELADPAISADSSRVVYLGDLDGDGLGLELLSQPLDGSAPPLRLHAPLAAGGSVSALALAPDARHVVFSADLDALGATELFSVPIAAADDPQRISGPLGAGRAVAGFAISADSRHVVYLADQDTDEVRELYRAPIEGLATHARRPGAPPPDAFGHVDKLSDNGDVADFELSGASVLFHAHEGELLHLFRVPLDARTPSVRLSGPEGSSDLQLDAAGTRAAYRGSLLHETDVHVYSAPVDGSSPALRLDDPQPHAILGGVGTFELHPDKKRLFFVASKRQYETGELFVTRIDRAAPIERLDGLFPEDYRLEDFRLASEVERVVYLLVFPYTGGDYRIGLFSAPLDGSAPGLLLTDDGPQRTEWYLVARDRVVYLTGLLGDLELFSVPLDGSAAPVRLNLPFNGGHTFDFRLAADGSYAVYFANQFRSNQLELFTVPTDGSALARRLNGPLVTGGDVRRYELAPDSSRVVYAADQERENTVELYSVRIDGSAPPLKLHPTQPALRDIGSFAISPDSRRVVYVADQTVAGRHELYSVPIDGSASPIELDPAQLGSADVGSIAISPDGRRVVYESDSTVHGQVDIRSVPIDGSAPSVRLNPPLVAGGNVLLSAAPPAFTGGWVAYWADQEVNDRYELFSAPLDGSAPARKLSRTQGQWGAVHWAFQAAAGRVVFLANEEGQEYERFELFEVPIDGSAPVARVNRPLVPGGTIPRFPRTPFQIASDGNSVLYVGAQDAANVYELYQGILGVPTRQSDPPR